MRRRLKSLEERADLMTRQLNMLMKRLEDKER